LQARLQRRDQQQKLFKGEARGRPRILEAAQALDFAVFVRGMLAHVDVTTDICVDFLQLTQEKKVSRMTMFRILQRLRTGGGHAWSTPLGFKWGHVEKGKVPRSKEEAERIIRENTLRIAVAVTALNVRLELSVPRGAQSHLKTEKERKKEIKR
jgi:hypothetical protein